MKYSSKFQNLDEKEIEKVSDVLKSDWLTKGPAVSEFESRICRFIGCKNAITVSSGTAALELAIKSLGIPVGSEIITTPLTFAADANALINMGMNPVLIDIKKDSFNIDPKKIEGKITTKTKAILFVDYAGIPCNIDKIKRIAEERNLYLIEDAAHALGSSYKGKKIGSISNITIFSLHPTKIITTGEGGIITTNNDKLAKKLRILRDQGLIRPKDFKWDYDLEESGNNYRMTDFQAAMGKIQLSKINHFIKKRIKVVKTYNNIFLDKKEFEIPTEYNDTEVSWYTYPLLLPEDISRDNVYKKLKSEGINVNVYYKPLSRLSLLQKKHGINPEDYPCTEKVFKRLINLPVSPNIKEEEAKIIATKVLKVVENTHDV